MDIQQIRYVVALSEEMHFNRAAARVHVTQPTLSQGIKKLEGEIGTPLFERSPQKVQLTPAGRKFLPHAIAILEELRRGTSTLRETLGEVRGTVRVGAIPTVCPYLMPEVITAVRKEAPRLGLELYEETTSLLVEHLKAGRLDLGVLSLPIKDRGLSSLSICHEPFYLAVSKKHRLSALKKVGLKEIERERLLILQEGHCFGDQSIEYCKLRRHDAPVRFLGSSLTSVMRLAASGEGATFVPKMAVDTKAYPNLKYLELASSGATRELGVVWRLSSSLDRAKRFCIDTVEQVLRKKTRLRPGI